MQSDISSLRIREGTKRELTKIAGELAAKDGVMRSMEEIILILIERYHKR